jgi:hypothetical protein
MTLRCLALIVVALALARAADAGTLENLERERALAIDTMLDPQLAPADRHARLDAAKVRLIDLERMVLRDDSLRGRATPTVRKAFENYDLTFLAHAAAEKKLDLVDLWLDQIGVTTEGLMSATIRRRY